MTETTRRYDLMVVAVLLGGKIERGIREQRTSYRARAFNQQMRAFKPRIFWPLPEQLERQREKVKR